MAERDDIEQGLRTLAGWTCGVRIEDIPESVLQRAALVIGDDIAAMVAARREPEVVCIQGQLLRNVFVSEATVFRGRQERADRFTAAVANAVAATWPELDEGYRKVTCHAGLYTLPALLAEAEAERENVGDVLRSVVVSYEFITRIARAWRFPKLILHPHAVFATVGAAAAIASVRGLVLTEFLNAITASATLITVGPFDHGVRGALVRNVWVAGGSWNGMRCVDWARCGITGLDSTLYDVYTFGLGGETHPEELVNGLGKAWAICEGYHKAFACCQYGHSAIEAALSLRGEIPKGKGVADIQKIIVETHDRGLTLDNYHPETTLAAKFSMPHMLAASLVLGHAGTEAFGSASLTSPEIAQLRESVELRRFLPDQPWPYDRPARVTAVFEDGNSLTKECLSAKGGPDRPFSVEEILKKISTLTGEVYPNLTPTVVDLLTLNGSMRAKRWDELVAQLTQGR